MVTKTPTIYLGGKIIVIVKFKLCKPKKKYKQQPRISTMTKQCHLLVLHNKILNNNFYRIKSCFIYKLQLVIKHLLFVV